MEWGANTGGASPLTARTDHAMCYHGARNRTVLFGGVTNPNTFEWNGTTWTTLAIPGPGPRYGAPMCYDSDRQKNVLYGGRALAPAAIADTWEYDGAWLGRHIPGPSERTGHSMVYDSVRHVTLLFGGRGWNDDYRTNESGPLFPAATFPSSHASRNRAWFAVVPHPLSHSPHRAFPR